MDWDDLVLKHHGLLCWHAIRAGWSYEDADDIAQNTWVRVWKSYPKWNQCKPMGFLLYSLRLEMVDERRRQLGRYKQRPLVFTNWGLKKVPYQGLSPVEEAMIQEHFTGCDGG